MLLENLPSELLVMVLRKVQPQDRFRIRQTSRTFFSLVDSVGILPLPPCTGVTSYRIHIDFECKVFAVSTVDEDGKRVSFAVIDRTNEDNVLSMSLKVPAIRYIKLHEWDDFLHQYLRRFSKSKEQGKDVHLKIALDRKDRTPTLRLLTTEIKKLTIEAPRRPCLSEAQLNSLDNWKRSIVSEVTEVLHHNLELTPSQLDNVTVPVFSCFLNDDAAVNILKRFRAGTLPPLRHWSFENSRLGDWTKFAEELEDSVSLDVLINVLNGEFLEANGPYQIELSCWNLAENISRKYLEFELTIEPYTE